MRHIIILVSFLLGTALHAEGLHIHATEWGVAKFHRQDNKTHPYSSTQAWRHSIMPDGEQQGPLVFKNDDGSYSVIFKTLEELLSSTEQLVQNGSLIESFDINAHGLPGTMWFPEDAQILNSYECSQWRESADGDDGVAYNQYYSPVEKYEIMQIRDMADSGFSIGCSVTGQSIAKALSRHPALAKAFSPDANISFLSCVVGLGKVGEQFTQKIAEVLLPAGGKGVVQTSIPYGLGDWSIDDGMGFWDYQNDEQLDHDNEIYPVDKKDASIQQKGTIRVGRSTANGVRLSVAVDETRLTFGKLPSYQHEAVTLSNPMVLSFLSAEKRLAPGTRIHIPGTNVYTIAK